MKKFYPTRSTGNIRIGIEFRRRGKHSYKAVINGQILTFQLNSRSSAPPATILAATQPYQSRIYSLNRSVFFVFHSFERSVFYESLCKYKYTFGFFFFFLLFRTDKLIHSINQRNFAFNSLPAGFKLRQDVNPSFPTACLLIQWRTHVAFIYILIIRRAYLAHGDILYFFLAFASFLEMKTNSMSL